MPNLIFDKFSTKTVILKNAGIGYKMNRSSIFFIAFNPLLLLKIATGKGSLKRFTITY